MANQERTIEAALEQLEEVVGQSNPFNFGFKQRWQSESKAQNVDKSAQAREEAIKWDEGFKEDDRFFFTGDWNNSGAGAEAAAARKRAGILGAATVERERQAAKQAAARREAKEAAAAARRAAEGPVARRPSVKALLSSRPATAGVRRSDARGAGVGVGGGGRFGALQLRRQPPPQRGQTAGWCVGSKSSGKAAVSTWAAPGSSSNERVKRTQQTILARRRARQMAAKKEAASAQKVWRQAAFETRGDEAALAELADSRPDRVARQQRRRQQQQQQQQQQRPRSAPPKRSSSSSSSAAAVVPPLPIGSIGERQQDEQQQQQQQQQRSSVCVPKRNNNGMAVNPEKIAYYKGTVQIGSSGKVPDHHCWNSTINGVVKRQDRSAFLPNRCRAPGIGRAPQPQRPSSAASHLTARVTTPKGATARQRLLARERELAAHARPLRRGQRQRPATAGVARGKPEVVPSETLVRDLMCNPVPYPLRMHMDGILSGLPGKVATMSSNTQYMAVQGEAGSPQGMVADEYWRMMGEVDKHSFLQKTDYSAYVEARAKYGKLEADKGHH